MPLKNRQKILLVSFLFLAIIIIAFCYFWYAKQFGLLDGFPKGRDVYAYLFRIQFIKTYFPHLDWNHLWDAGVPFYIWSYPPLSMLLPAGLSVFLNLSAATALSTVTIVMWLLFFLGIFGCLQALTKNIFLSFSATVFLLSNPTTWGWWADGGNYSRLIGLGFLGLALFSAGFYLDRTLAKKKAKGFLILAILFLHFCLTTHFLTGALACLVIFWLIILAVRSRKQKIWQMFKLLAWPLFLSAYFLLPFFFTGKPVGFLGKTWTLKRILLKHLVLPDPELPFSSWLWPFLALVGLSLVMVVFSRLILRKAQSNRLLAAGFWTSLILGIPAVIYLVIGNLDVVPYEFFINGLPPSSAIVITTLILTILMATGFQISLNRIKGSRLKAGLGVALGIVILGGSVAMVSRLSVFQAKVFEVNLEEKENYLSDDKYVRQAFWEVVDQNPKPENFRFGTNSAYVADWFNFYFPQTPQTRDFFAQGVPYPDWTFLLEQTVWSEANQMPATKFWLDWYAVKNFLVSRDQGMPGKFFEDEAFRVVATNFETEIRSPAVEFEFSQSSPILGPAEALSLLIIGQAEEYKIMMRNLARQNMNSQKIIPVDGGEKIGRHLSDLTDFDLVFLYGLPEIDQGKVVVALENYVHQGGWLIIETSPDQDLKMEKTVLPSFFPTDQFEIVQLNDWQLKGQGEFKKKNLAAFSPGVCEGNPWKGAAANSSQLRDWAKPMVVNGDQILMAKGNLGEGKVIWSGINLPFHADYYQNLFEAELLGELLFGGIKINQTTESPNFSVEMAHPGQHAIILKQPAKGVLFKESYFSGWRAKLVGEGKPEQLKIYPAGPSLMYVFLKGEATPAKIVFEYQLTWQEKLGRFLSLAAFLGILDFVFGSHLMTVLLKPFLKR